MAGPDGGGGLPTARPGVAGDRAGRGEEQATALVGVTERGRQAVQLGTLDRQQRAGDALEQRGEVDAGQVLDDGHGRGQRLGDVRGQLRHAGPAPEPFEMMVVRPARDSGSDAAATTSGRTFSASSDSPASV
jgi:hypothetical protein